MVYIHIIVPINGLYPPINNGLATFSTSFLVPQLNVAILQVVEAVASGRLGLQMAVTRRNTGCCWGRCLDTARKCEANGPDTARIWTLVLGYQSFRTPFFRKQMLKWLWFSTKIYKSRMVHDGAPFGLGLNTGVRSLPPPKLGICVGRCAQLTKPFKRQKQGRLGSSNICSSSLNL